MTSHFSLEEMTRSAVAELKGIDNTPPSEILPALQFTAEGMERIRSVLGHSINVNSGYRCPELNAAVGGSKTSQHCKGEACDFTCPKFGTPRAICIFLTEKMLEGELGIDQLIFENTWVHVSFSKTPRNQVLTKIDGRYIPGIV